VRKRTLTKLSSPPRRPELQIFFFLHRPTLDQHLQLSHTTNREANNQFYTPNPGPHLVSLSFQQPRNTSNNAPTQASTKVKQPSSSILVPTMAAVVAPRYSFSFDDFLKKEYRFGIAPDQPTCKAFLAGHCPLGNSCPDKHPARTTQYNK
jgi:hypothetical protein